MQRGFEGHRGKVFKRCAGTPFALAAEKFEAARGELRDIKADARYWQRRRSVDGKVFVRDDFDVGRNADAFGQQRRESGFDVMVVDEKQTVGSFVLAGVKEQADGGGDSVQR